MKRIEFSKHALQRRQERPFTVEQVEAAIRGARWKPAEGGRLQCRMDFAFGKTHKGRSYDRIGVRPIFVEEHDRIVVVTVYTYLF